MTSATTAAPSRIPHRFQRAVRGLVDQSADPKRTGPHTLDWILVGVVVAGCGVEAALRTDLTWPLASFATAVAMAATLPWRRIRPALMTWIAYVAAAILTIASALVTGHAATTGVYSAAVPALVLPYALFRWGSGREILAGKLALVMIWVVCTLAAVGTLSDLIGGLIVLILPCLAGWGVRATVDAQRRRLGEVAAVERERLARELHDTIAHHVSAIAIQAQAGQAQATLDPSAAVLALGVIESEASRTLAEMRTIVKMLRGASEHRATHVGDAAPLAPATTADLERLAPVNGITMSVHRSDGVDRLPPAIDHAVYRIVQESVTNAVRHAHTATRVEVAVDVVDDVAVVDVADDGGPSRAPHGDGYGLVGMSERARLLGGSLSAGPTATGWQVHAELPLEAVAQPVRP